MVKSKSGEKSEGVHSKSGEKLEGVCNWSGKPVKGFLVPITDYFRSDLEESNLVGFSCQSCKATTLLQYKNLSGIIYDKLGEDTERLKCTICGEENPEYGLIFPEGDYSIIKDSEGKYYDDYDGESLVRSASINIMFGHLDNGGKGDSGCPYCGGKTLNAKLIGVTRDEFEALQKESNFSKILNAQIKTVENKGCFIATACYGNPACYEIHLLRQFRDQRLINNRIGSLSVKYYYRLSPRLASYFRKHPLLANIVKTRILNPIISLIR